ncbi:hypothetical protein GQ44DRAFT_718438 [Phaeosphaeriaceae sp. PMI808]|nr:hypothetical protein GQ44DRAFT_718438 [Phaeosphaeriaceae sp. PMI808]
MPIDRNPQTNLKPKLASNRTAKTPLTPRLAVTSSTAAANGSQLGRNVRTSTATTPRVNIAAQSDVTPVKAFLNNNVTPRSSSRKSRVGVESTSSTPGGTPTSTPTSSRPASTIDFAPRELVLGNKGVQGGVQSRLQATPAPRLPLSNIYNPVSSDAVTAKPTSPLFFHASDVRPHEPAPTQKKAPVFFYANGKQDHIPRKNGVPSPPLSAMGKPQQTSKFFHADSISEPKTQPPMIIPSPLSTSPEPQNLNTVQGSSFREPSPTKEWAHLSYRKGASQVMRPSIVSRNSALSILSGPNTPDIPDRSSRRSSVASYAMRGGHGKSASMSSIDSVADLKQALPNEPTAPSPSPLNTRTRVVSTGSLADSIASVPSPPTPTLSGLPPSTPTSPIGPGGGKSALETMNELAANARRERKVLDLEISNSSLLAINRSLEKEVRKQKAELRRFRRMTRAGRFSMDAAGPTPDIAANVTSHIVDLSDMSEGEEVEELPEEDLESSDSSIDEGQMSPTAQQEWDEAHRLKDEKRLQLDLTKHRDLLLDSQKMNQSLKRCMNWTEQLIKDGQKALKYQVHVSDVRLGGRVLVAEDDDADLIQAEESRGLLSPWSPLHGAIEGIDALDSPFFATAVERIVDRDSAIDIEGLENLGTSEPDTTCLGSPFEERIRRLHASIEELEAS